MILYALILAAGRSRRMGVQKLLLPFGDTTILGRVVSEIARTPVAGTFVVVRPDAPRVAQALAGLAVETVPNPDPAGDMWSSIRCGWQQVPAEANTVLIALGDQPTIRAELIRALCTRFDNVNGRIVVPSHQGRRGHPVLLDASYREEALASYEEVGLRGLLAAHTDKVLELDWPDAHVLSDIDTPADYQRAVGKPPIAPSSALGA